MYKTRIDYSDRNEALFSNDKIQESIHKSHYRREIGYP